MSETTVPVRMELRRRFPVSASEGFDYITDLGNWPEYWPRVVRIDPGSRWREPGDRTRLSLRMLGRTIELEMTLERFDPHCLVEYGSRQRGLPPVAHERHFTEVDGGFEFRIIIEYVPRRGLRGILDRVLFRRAAERAMRETMDNLERRFEARKASSEPPGPNDAADDLGRVVFLHSDVGDARMWAAQQELLREGFDTVALDLHELGMGPGEFSFVGHVAERLPAILVGNSFGGRVALETALAFADRVPRLVLVDPAIGDHEWSHDMREYLRREEGLLDAGDIDAAVELNLERWALPHVRDVLRPMQRRALKLDAARKGEPIWPEPRPLSALAMPVLVIVGERDTEDMEAIAHRIAHEAPDARLEVIAHASHHPSLEQPDAFNRLLLEFLAQSANPHARRSGSHRSSGRTGSTSPTNAWAKGRPCVRARRRSGRPRLAAAARLVGGRVHGRRVGRAGPGGSSDVPADSPSRTMRTALPR